MGSVKKKPAIFWKVSGKVGEGAPLKGDEALSLRWFSDTITDLKRLTSLRGYVFFCYRKYFLCFLEANILSEVNKYVFLIYGFPTFNLR